MTFDLTVWKAQLGERLRSAQSPLRDVGVQSMYGTLAGAALWPLVEAARTGDPVQWALALGAVFSGVGGNLVAEQVQRWRDRKESTEAQASEWVATCAQTDRKLREELDTILERLEAVPLAQAAAAESGTEAALVNGLRAELERLGSLPRFEAVLRGSPRSAVAQGEGAVAVAGGMAAGRDMTGNIVIIGHGNRVASPIAREPGRVDQAHRALEAYRRWLVRSCEVLPLQGLDVQAVDPTHRGRLGLAEVYIGLDTRTAAPEQTGGKSRRQELGQPRALGALEAAIANREQVILGDPGSGKSTFLNWTTLCLAAHGLDPQAGWSKRLEGWPKAEADLIPVPVVLRDFARSAPHVTRSAAPSDLWEFMVHRLRQQTLEAAAPPLQRALEDGRAIVFLDGLDEIHSSAQRGFVREAVLAFAKQYERCRYIATCRTLSYQDPQWRLGVWPAFELAPFDREKIDQFITAWYQELTRLGAVAAERAGHLESTLKLALRRPELARLAPNPLLLTQMALVHAHEGLPDARAQLYEKTVDLLLWRWEKHKGGSTDEAPGIRTLLQQASLTEADLKITLQRLAFEAHAASAGGDSDALADISEATLERALVALHPQRPAGRDWAHEVIAAMKERAGLLIERAPGVYTFPHRTFQEYLAGCHLAAQGSFSETAARLLAEGVYWQPAILLAVDTLVSQSRDTDKPLALVGALCPDRPVADAASGRRAWQAGEVLAELGPRRVEGNPLGRRLTDEVRTRLVEVIRGPHLVAVERAAAGTALARVGDPRFRADLWHLPNEPLLGFVKVPEGPFQMGSDRKRDQLATKDEQPQHEVTLPTYFIGRYPVTVAQFQAFVEHERFAPGDPDCLRGVSNHPVVSVSWDEAMAYADWLTRRFRESEHTPEPLATLLRNGAAGSRPWVVTLPSEAEWEKAARGVDGRTYPWGEEPDPNLANYHHSGIGGTSAVGCFPGGHGPYEVEELSGNVWEWTRSLYEKYPYKRPAERERRKASEDALRVLRGGACFSLESYVRAAVRYRFHSRLRDYFIGFRVVVSPFHSEL